jgi:molybdate transport system substrate-binding protein
MIGSKIMGLRGFLVIAALAVLLGAACRRAGPAALGSNAQVVGETTVSAAASLREAFQEIGRLHETRAHVRTNFNFGASGALQKQIESGAPVDVFASAGGAQMDALAAQSLIAPETRRDFARNSLVLIMPADSSLSLKSFTDLSDAKVTKIAIGNSKTVPAGQYAEQSLTRLGLWQRLQPLLILAEDVRQVLDYVARGEVDAGIVYASDARAAGEKVRTVATAPPDSHDPILYPAAVVRASAHPEAARAFIETIVSDEGQRILEKYGFERVR